jgi:hypothetical protein
MSYLNVNKYKKIKSERKLIYDHLAKKKYKNLLNLLFEIKISNYDLKRLRLVIKELILTSLNIYYKKKFDSVNKYLDFYRKYISGLPNITPNGNIMPRRELLIFYKKLHTILERILKKSLTNSYNYLTRPYILYKDPNSPFKKKDRATNKWHTDLWAGHNLSSIAFILIDGDYKNNCLSVSFPKNIKSTYFNKIKKYDYGKNLYSSRIFLKKCNNSKLYIMDNLLLHKTHLNKYSRPRVGIQFGINFNWKVIKNSKYEIFKKSKLNSASYLKTLGKKSLFENY